MFVFLFSVPSRVVSVKVTERTENSIRLEWQSANINWVYKVLLNGSDVPAGSTSADLPKLLPGTKYVVSVISQFSGFSSAAFDVVTVTSKCNILLPDSPFQHGICNFDNFHSLQK